ncbi:MAG: hypothetical protein JO036_02295 [Candidatus Eremiobacteraeota bacterium]|nr:hypothetical protein [Candidatus Eremiobacteraeota bacterium]
MIDWLRRADPAFYGKEPHLLRAQAEIARYTDDAQAEVRLEVLASDRLLHVATAVVAAAAYAAVTGAGALNARGEWPTVWAFAVLAVAGARALPWSTRHGAAASWRAALAGLALVAIPALWTRLDLGVIVTALLAGAALALSGGGRARAALPALAVGVLFGERMPAYPPVVLRLAGGILAAAAGLAAVWAIAPVWRLRAQVLTWGALAALLLACAYAAGFDAAALAPAVRAEIAALAVAYLGVCVVAGRIRRAELLARPRGVLTLPQSIVPLLDRSHHHAVICRLD